ncbi:NifB/NifX family molybdenum-iron cluster-binding protein [Clostridium cellulovorans]|uniref:Dinitrogenase iron-molybdenum cofactor biosynthesis protein n=1 Tax=Clostridium cellulovorans (strain ATCC 35296 / DSM 3052 / OCM 3 / 743B) TaxID=573061 RepID=D9SU06_CLOC7|nr:NifB/NifX family molybdenum-iron cluster-binding protein [Clostridium cellulovorans]ADL50844.1 Dinitrogenase iron-molybdenum cofactor biosynthesis protein [Clostridium cellulovorans 743B]
MKICIPLKEDKGLESIPYNHFGSAPIFMIYDSENAEVKVIPNSDLNHQHGMCHPEKALGGEKVDAILVGGIGAGALSKLQAKEIRVYKVDDSTVLNNINLLKENKLTEFSVNHSCNHDCAH